MNTENKNSEKQILVVDDCADNISLLRLILETQSYRIKVAMSGKEALKLVSQDRPDLILLDLMMPEMNGYEVLARLREDNYPLIPVFLVTANRYISRDEAIAAGANGIIYKPVDIKQLLFEVVQILENETLSFHRKN